MREILQAVFKKLEKRMTRSAGVLAWRLLDGKIEVLIGESGGPYCSGRQRRWGIPKGMIEGNESDEEAAIREFEEETGFKVPENPELIDLGECTSFSGKVVRVYALQYDFAPGKSEMPAGSNSFEMEWPPRSGVIQSFPEVERLMYCSIDEAEHLIFPYQREILGRARYLV